MLLLSPELVFIENEAASLCVSMWKRSTPTLATIWHKYLWQDICLIENRNCNLPLQSVITRKRDVPNPMFLYFS